MKNFVRNIFFDLTVMVKLIEKKADYRKMHMNPGGWVYERFDIPVVKALDDVLEVGKGLG